MPCQDEDLQMGEEWQPFQDEDDDYYDEYDMEDYQEQQ